MICQAEGLAVGLDTEGAVIRTKEIGGENVEYFENDGIGYVYWTDEDTYYSFSGYVEVDELLKIAVLMAAAVFLCGISINVSAAEGGESGIERRGTEISIIYKKGWKYKERTVNQRQPIQR